VHAHRIKLRSREIPCTELTKLPEDITRARNSSLFCLHLVCREIVSYTSHVRSNKSTVISRDNTTNRNVIFFFNESSGSIIRNRVGDLQFVGVLIVLLSHFRKTSA